MVIETKTRKIGAQNDKAVKMKTESWRRSTSRVECYK